MSVLLHPYSEYKPSGVGWLGEIPGHWTIKQLKYAVMFQRGHDLPSSDREDGEIPLVTSAGITSSHSVACAKGPGIVTGRYGTIGEFYFIEHDFWPLNTTLYTINLRGNNVKFLLYLLKHISPLFLLNAVKSAVPGVDRNDIHQTVTVIPPLPEQQAIAAFLDRKTQAIDTVIRQKERLIVLLQEKRQALISQAVTKGLDPTVPMKDSGIEWLGEIPAHWEVKRLKHIARLQTGLTLGKDFFGRKVERRCYLRVANVLDGSLDLATITEIELPTEDISRYELRVGDVLMTEGGDFDKLGRGYVWEGQIKGCLHQNHIFAVRPVPDLLSPWHLAYILKSGHGKNYFTSTSQQTTNLATTNSTKLMSFTILLPPLHEQEDIVMRLNKTAGSIDSATESLATSVGRLREYRQTLISATVTGKIDVRQEVVV